MGTTIHFPQSRYELEEQLPPSDSPASSSTPEPTPLEPDTPEPSPQFFPQQPTVRRLSGYKPAVTAALWGLAAAGVLLGCREPMEAGGLWIREMAVSAAALLVTGWCGLSPAGQPGMVLVLLLRAMATGAVAAGVWQGSGELRPAAVALIPYALSLTLLISEAADGMMASFRVVRRLRGGKAAGAGKFLLRSALRMIGAGLVWVLWAWGTGLI